ncbi:MAG: hypothetical protein U9N53_10570 [Bacteroidota bacterium]|nr:hypothetical protein [Bacteroidota bacterium]
MYRPLYTNLTITLLLLLFITSPAFSQEAGLSRLKQKASKKLETWNTPLPNWNHLGNISLDSISVIQDNKKILLFFNNTLSYIPFRENDISVLSTSLSDQLGRAFRKYDIEVYTDSHLIEELVPNRYRKNFPIDPDRLSKERINTSSFIRKIDSYEPVLGLNQKIIALWPSHGYYYESKLDRWEWQRARLHTTVEDIFPMGFILPYLVPMLENAGATLFLPRERDTQVHEVLVDNDISTGFSEIEISGLIADTIAEGFLWTASLKINENPFQMGSHLSFSTSSSTSGAIIYIPDIPEDGDYAVHISYAEDLKNVNDVKYTIQYSGGEAEYLVNQKMGAGTWIYLGTYHFLKGKNKELSSVKISAKSSGEGRISTDAIRFGGGMGNIARRPSSELLPNQWSLRNAQNEGDEEIIEIDPNEFTWKISNKPRYMEAARYYLQYAGMPDSIVYNLNQDKNDYNDDYQSRGEWVNFLMGNPNGPTGHRKARGLKIPVDLALAFHTDAGVTANDSIIGTLAIYSSDTDNGLFPNGQSKMASRDFSDIVQSQIVEDLRIQFRPDWTRRGLWNKQYSEAYRPNVPALLLELLSHQNLADMYFGLDPRFRFVVSRSIYKGMLKFLAYQEGKDYVVQPLPVNKFSISSLGDKTIRLSWKAVNDLLEPTAKPDQYKLYKRIGKNGFDQGVIINDTTIVLTLEEYNKIYSFKITALNGGGESFPSEILSTGFINQNENIALVVNGFDRISGPSKVDVGNMAGIIWWEDQGVPYKRELGYTGVPYDFNRQSPWLDDDSPGWGASHGNFEGEIIPGNSFDFTYTHGEAIMAAGKSFVSLSDEAFEEESFNSKPFCFVDIIFGEEKSTPIFMSPAGGEINYDFKIFTPKTRVKLQQIADQGGNIFISGAYIGSDHILTGDTVTRNFTEDILHFKWRTNHAVLVGEVYATDYSKPYFTGKWDFNTGYHPEIYTVEAPDAIEPSGIGAVSSFRYRENNASAGISFKGAYRTVVLGLPFEAIPDQNQRLDLMKQIVHFFETDQ